MYQLNWPIETPEAIAFWGSSHKCNTMKAYVAFSHDEANFNELTKRAGYKLQWRKRAWSAFSAYVANPSMVGVPFTADMTPWWEEMPNIYTPGRSFPIVGADFNQEDFLEGDYK